MTPDPVVLASQLAWQLLAWPLSVLLAVAVWRGRRRQPRQWVPAAGIIGILVASACGVLLPSAAPWSAAPWFGAAWFGLLPLVLSSYPDGHFVPRWLVAPVAGYLAVGVAYWVTGGAVAGQPWWAVVAPGLLLLVAAPLYRYLRRATTAERESARWGLLGAVISVDAFLLLLLIEGGSIAGSGGWSVGLANLAGLPIPVALSLGLLRPRLCDVDAALRAVLAVSMAAALLGAGAWAVGAALAAIGATSTAGGLAAAVAAVAAAVPAWRLSAWLAERLVYRGRLGSGAAVALLGGRLSALPAAALAPQPVVDVAAAALRLQGVWLRSADEADAAARPVGDARAGVAPAWVVWASTGPVEPGPGAPGFPVSYNGELLATLEAAPRRGESALTRSDERVLRQIAVHAAPAVHGARAFAELSDAHARVVLAREEERKSLRRDLHDDLGPTLAGLGLGAAAIERLSAGDSPVVAALAGELRAGIAAAVAQTRELSLELRPPILDELGLVEAVRRRVGGQSADALLVRINAPAVRLDLPAAVDLAALRIVQEAVANVRKHAAAGLCVIDIRMTGHALHVSVSDDGVGMPRRVRPGIGLRSMRERAAELGGSLQIGAGEGGGSAIHLELPLRPGGRAPTVQGVLV